MHIGAMKRFYQTVGVAGAGAGFTVALDGKAILTPRKATLLLPTRALADAVAEEWRRQGDEVRPETMALLKLANTAIDRVGPNRAEVIEALAGYARSDLVCYQAVEPEPLVIRQVALWRPLLDGLRERHGIALRSTHGIVHIAQDEAAISALRNLLALYGDMALAALHEFATLTGSVVIALALAEAILTLDAAWDAALVDENYQAEFWGVDEEAAERLAGRRGELGEASMFLELLGAQGPLKP